MIEYWKARLPKFGQESYRILRDAIVAGELKAEVPLLSDTELGDTVTAITLDHPEFYFIAREYGVSRRKETSVVQLKSLYSEHDRSEIDLALYSVVSEVRRSLSGGSVEDAEKRIADYIVKNTYYEQNPDRNQNAASTLYYHKAQCSGIAKAVKYLLDRLGKWCIVVKGTAKNDSGKQESHAWNIVCWNNNYYHLDVTYLLGANINAKRGDPIRYLYFNYSDEEMKKTHHWERQEVPACTDKSFDCAFFGVAKEQIYVVASQDLAAYFKRCGGRVFRFRLKEKCEIPVLQQRIAAALQEYCRTTGISGMIKLSCIQDIWETEIK